MLAARLFAILMLKAGPQDIPYSVGMTIFTVLLYALSDYVTVLDNETVNVGGLILTDVALLLGFSYMLLTLLGFRPRFAQTITALAGTGMIFNLLSWPLLVQLAGDNVPESVSSLVVLLILMLMSWHVLVTAHIYRNALETTMLRAILLSFGLLFLSIALTRLFFTQG